MKQNRDHQPDVESFKRLLVDMGQELRVEALLWSTPEISPFARPWSRQAFLSRPLPMERISSDSDVPLYARNGQAKVGHGRSASRTLAVSVYMSKRDNRPSRTVHECAKGADIERPVCRYVPE